jgi:hypothetical protein
VSDAPPRLEFSVAGVRAADAAAPTLAFAVRIEASGEHAIRGLGLNVALRICAERRRYAAGERERLCELFGPPGDWSRSLGPVPWAKLAVNVPAFWQSTCVDVHVPCTYDFEVASAKYLSALADGDVPVELLFSGMLHYAGSDGRQQTVMIPWDREAAARLPVSVWREAIDSAFPDTAWLRVRRDLFARLQAYRSTGGSASWDDVLERLLAHAEA